MSAAPRRRRLRAALLAATLLVGTLPVAAARGGPPSGEDGPRHPHRGPRPLERVLERHAERLGLDDDTRARIREIAEEGRAGSEPLHDELHRLRDEMRSLLSADAPDEDRVMALAGEIGEVETVLRRHRLRTMLRIRALLTPEQRSALVELHRERHRRHDTHGPSSDD